MLDYRLMKPSRLLLVTIAIASSHATARCTGDGQNASTGTDQSRRASDAAPAQPAPASQPAQPAPAHPPPPAAATPPASPAQPAPVSAPAAATPAATAVALPDA